MKLKNGWQFITDRTKAGRGRYALDKNDGRGAVPLTGCTTILGEQSKPFLIDWAASEAYKQSLDYIKKSATSGANGWQYLIQEFEQIIKLKKWAHTQKSTDAKDIGTEAHALVESFIDHYIATKEYKIPDMTQSSYEARVSATRFFDWAIEAKVEFTQSEISVFHGDLYAGGSFDFICKINGDWYLGDFKTSKQIDDTYYAQTAFYIKAVNYIQELQGEVKTDFKGAVIIKSVKQEGDIEYMKKAGAGWKKVIIPKFEVKFVQDIDRHFLYFKSLFNAYKYNKDQRLEFFEEYASKYPELSDEELAKLELEEIVGRE